MVNNCNIYAAGYRKSEEKYPFKKTEAKATEWLQERVYYGVGERYLGWQDDIYDILPDGSEKLYKKGGPRVWRTPQMEERYKWRPAIEHLQASFRGLVAGSSTHVPFVTTELDRHSGRISSREHIRDAISTARLLQTQFGVGLKWCAEVNRHNGSVKFFGWASRPIDLATAKKIGNLIQAALAENNLLGSGREVFPFNHPQVLLPMRCDKTTIIDAGVLAKCVRKAKDRETGKLEPYTCYSILSFCEWLRGGRHFDYFTLLKALQEGCANLPDDLSVPATKVSISVPTAPRTAPTVSKCSYVVDDVENPNSFERQHAALLVYCRKMRQVVTVQDAMDHIKNNRLFSGRWEDNYARRQSRVRWILGRIAETFDPSKGNGVRHEVEVGKFDNWAKTHVGKVQGKSRRYLDEFGAVVQRESRYSVDWQFASAFLSIVEFCLLKSPNEDKSLPQVRAEDVWTRCFSSGLVTVPFCEKKWAICRDHLEQLGIIKVFDRNWYRGKAMRWEVSDCFGQLPKWYRKAKQPSLQEAVDVIAVNRISSNNPTLNTYPSLDGVNKCFADDCPLLEPHPPP